MSLSDELLSTARRGQRHRGPLGWLERISEEHRAAIEKTRTDWQQTGGRTSGVSAARLARVICERLTEMGYAMPGEKAVATWLLQAS